MYNNVYIGKKSIKNISHGTHNIKDVNSLGYDQDSTEEGSVRGSACVRCECNHEPKCLKQCGDVRCTICIYNPIDAYSNEQFKLVHALRPKLVDALRERDLGEDPVNLITWWLVVMWSLGPDYKMTRIPCPGGTRVSIDKRVENGAEESVERNEGIKSVERNEELFEPLRGMKVLVNVSVDRTRNAECFATITDLMIDDEDNEQVNVRWFKRYSFTEEESDIQCRMIIEYWPLSAEVGDLGSEGTPLPEDD